MYLIYANKILDFFKKKLTILFKSFFIFNLIIDIEKYLKFNFKIIKIKNKKDFFCLLKLLINTSMDKIIINIKTIKFIFIKKLINFLSKSKNNKIIIILYITFLTSKLYYLNYNLNKVIFIYFGNIINLFIKNKLMIFWNKSEHKFLSKLTFFLYFNKYINIIKIYKKFFLFDNKINFIILLNKYLIYKKYLFINYILCLKKYI
ncbi:hypothetical protein ACT2CR_00530 [Candidatus Vidania fulgoroideorum]